MTDRRIFRDRLEWSELASAFRWRIPEHFNIAAACCDDWAERQPDRVAILEVRADGAGRDVTYGRLRDASNALANAFRARGLVAGDRSAVLLAQSSEVMIAHFAAFKCGMISLPLFTLFGEEGLEYRLRDAQARVLVTDQKNLEKIWNIKDKLPDLQLIYVLGGGGAGTHDFWAEIERASDRLVPVATRAEDPALILYTSGTTGPPKGALHAHRVVLGHQPAIELQHDFFPQPGDIGWTPADWAWIGGLMNTALICLFYGVKLIAHRMAKFDPDRAYALIQDQGIRNMFMPPTALRLMRQARAPAGLAVRSVMSGGESLGAEMLDWGRSALGVTINEAYGQTECNMCVTSAASLGVQRPGAIGRPVPGFDIAIIGPDGAACDPGDLGEIAIRKGAGSMFLSYWRAPEKTAEKFLGDWMRTGDLGVMDRAGYVTFKSRDDDVITSSGYRIGPTEIEACLTRHPDVAMAAVVGVPDPLRTEIVKAFIVLRDGAEQAGLESRLQLLVRDRLAPHCMPQQIEYVDELPMTATGKVMRRELRNRP